MAIKYVGGKIKRIHSQPFKPYRKKAKPKRVVQIAPQVSVWARIYQILLKRAGL